MVLRALGLVIGAHCRRTGDRSALRRP
jgi:hypothetical protein